ncbi:PLDc N-terminal domain-containing protein [Microbacterium xanthum]|uniref:PLDc N-terminal domain-containing protein n=1 Tax=Microbacterium xanthum TaxID=3079794 RepID=UPI002AD208D0|nr:PLDc N-terminal domain-containing protein [Microbacterium sp. KSW-48]MDZ8172476.1 PLDc N-terminal domain-containing protein [Microbacterium sp. KSW-48]
MSDEHNPLIPAGYDLVWSIVVVLVIALTIVALVTLARSARRLAATQALVWTVVVLLVRLIGSVAWLTVGRRAAPGDPTT